MRTAATLLVVSLACVAGCQRNATWLPLADKSLNRPPAEFAADAKARFPYPGTLPRAGELKGRAEVGYDTNGVNLVNYSDQPWTDVEVWINKSYVLHLDKVETGKSKWLPFELFYNADGQHFPENGAYVQQLELKKDGVLYDLPHSIGG